MTVVLFRVDASTTIGGGHAMRCLALAEALRAKRAECHFAAGTLTPALAERIGRDFPLHRFDAAADPGAGGADWDRTPWPVAAQDADREAFEAIRAALGAQTVVIDHYRLDASFSAPLAAKGVQIAVIDDLANRAQNCAVLVDHNLGRRRRDYAGLVPSDTRLLCGPAFALLRGEFAHLRGAAIERRGAGQRGTAVLVSLGTTDPGGASGAIVAELARIEMLERIDVVIGREAASYPALAALSAGDPRVVLHSDVSAMGALMTVADIAVGAGGTTSWERCTVGLPSVVLTLAANQKLVVEELAAAGAAIAVADARGAAAAVNALGEDPDALGRMAAAAFAVADGRGAARVAAAIMAERSQVALEITVRPSRNEDSAALWAWRNDVATRASSRSPDIVGWADHRHWFTSALASATRTLMIAEADGDAIAAVRFDSNDGDGAEVSINLAPHARGLGLGTAVLHAACAAFAAGNPGLDRLTATIHADNPASQAAFAALGFVPLGDLDVRDFATYSVAVAALPP